MDIELWKKRKKELHLTHDQLAEMSGVSRRVIAGIFAGDNRGQNPRLVTVQAIERALGLIETPADKLLSGKEERLLSAFNALIPPMQDYILEMTESLVGKQTPQTDTATVGKKHA